MTNPPESVPAPAVPPESGPAQGPSAPTADAPANGADAARVGAGAVALPAQPTPASDSTAPGQPASDSPAPDQPASEQTAPGQPAGAAVPIPSFGLPPTHPAPPTYDPSLMMQAMPVSALYVPVPTPPANGGGGGRVAVTVLSMLLTLFVLASGTLAVLYVRQGQESTRKSEQIAALEAEVSEMRRQLDATERGLRRADEDLADLQTERDAIAECLTAIYNYFDAVAEADGAETPQTEEARLQASSVCREADQYL